MTIRTNVIHNLVGFGWISDKSPSRQTPFVLGLVALGASTLCFALGSTIPVLLIARLLQGLSSAIVFTIGSALLLDVVGNEGIGQATGYTTMSITIGILGAPVAGGFIYDHGGYFAVFLPAFALIILDVILRFIMIVEKRVPFEPVPVESPKVTSSSIEVTGNTYGTYGNGIARADESVSKDDQTPGAVFCESQRGTEAESLLPKAHQKSGSSSILVLLSSSRFSVAIVCLLMVNSFTTGFDGVLAVYVHDIFDFDATRSACLFLILALPALFSPISGVLTDRFGTKLPATGGLLLLTPTLILLRLIQRGVATPFVKLGSMLFSIGVSVTLLNPAFIKEANSAVRDIEEKRPAVLGPYSANAQAFGLISCAFASGSMLGPIYAGFIRDRFGWPVMTLCMGVLSLILLILAVLVIGGREHGAIAASNGNGGVESA